jgi:hypothetical protein
MFSEIRWRWLLLSRICMRYLLVYICVQWDKVTVIVLVQNMYEIFTTVHLCSVPYLTEHKCTLANISCIFWTRTITVTLSHWTQMYTSKYLIHILNKNNHCHLISLNTNVQRYLLLYICVQWDKVTVIVLVQNMHEIFASVHLCSVR